MVRPLGTEVRQCAMVLQLERRDEMPGVYVTISQKAIDTAIARYETATDGALLYAEDAGRSSDAAIDLGEHGLFSRGMDRLPSGTLVVVGPVPLTQESWSDNKDRLNAAANLAHSSSLRVVVLAETPLPENLHSDIDLLLGPDDEGLDSDPADVLGIVTESAICRWYSHSCSVEQRRRPRSTSRRTSVCRRYSKMH